MWVLKEFIDSGKEIVIGCIGAEVNTEGTEVTIGPIAVGPEYQVFLLKILFSYESKLSIVK